MARHFAPLDDTALAATTGGLLPTLETPLDRIMIGQGDLWGGAGRFAYGHARGTTIYILDKAGELVRGITNLRHPFF